MKVDIFGSCITRDAFAIESNNIGVNAYYSRSSLISAVHKARELKDDVNLEHKFLKRSVEQDLSKKFRKYSRNPQSKVLIVDLIQERYFLNFLDGSISTYSPDYIRAKLPRGKIIRGDKQLELFKKYIPSIKKMLDRYELVIIHEANLTDRYKDEDNQDTLLKLSKKDEFFIEKGDEYYKVLKENLSRVETIRINGFYADPNHKWGISPSHYEIGYYEEFSKKLKEIIERYDGLL